MVDEQQSSERKCVIPECGKRLKDRQDYMCTKHWRMCPRFIQCVMWMTAGYKDRELHDAAVATGIRRVQEKIILLKKKKEEKHERTIKTSVQVL